MWAAPCLHVRVLGQPQRGPHVVEVRQTHVSTALDVERSQVQARSAVQSQKQERPQVLNYVNVDLQGA